MRDFVGMEQVRGANLVPRAVSLGADAACACVLPDASQVDSPTRRALVAFSYHLSIGNMDEAHRAVKLVKSAAPCTFLPPAASPRPLPTPGPPPLPPLPRPRSDTEVCTASALRYGRIWLHVR